MKWLLFCLIILMVGCTPPQTSQRGQVPVHEICNGYDCFGKFEDGNIKCYTWNSGISCVIVPENQCK